MNAFPGPATGAAADALARRLHREHFAGMGLQRGSDGIVSARFFHSLLGSAFQPIIGAAGGALAGHQGLLRVRPEGGDAIAPWGLFAQAADDARLVQLDRLARTVHALNYFPTAPESWRLFLNVERRLLSAVPADHGAYFEAILREMGIAPARVAIILPPEALERPAEYVRAAISYRIRGYRVVTALRAAPDDADFAHVLAADPHYVAVDAPLSWPIARREAARFRRRLETLRDRGTTLIARRIDTAEKAQAARDWGAGLLQGRLIGRESPA